MKQIAPLLAALAVAGCAHGGKLEVASRGDALVPGKSFALVPGQAASPADVRLAQALTAARLKPAAEPALADYLVTVAYTDRSSRIGVYIPSADPKAEPAWLAQGQKPPRAWVRKGATRLVVRIEDRASGQVAREVEVGGFYWRKNAPDRLAEAAAAGLLAPSLQPAGS